MLPREFSLAKPLFPPSAARTIPEGHKIIHVPQPAFPVATFQTFPFVPGPGETGHPHLCRGTRAFRGKFHDFRQFPGSFTPLRFRLAAQLVACPEETSRAKSTNWPANRLNVRYSFALEWCQVVLTSGQWPRSGILLNFPISGSVWSRQLRSRTIPHLS